MTDDIYEKCVNFLDDVLGIEKDKISPNTRINYDLGVDGDDGIELMDAFFERFSVQPGDFSYAKYFGPEAGANLFSLIDSMLNIFHLRQREGAITVQDLVDAIREGRWIK
ncbi:MAG: DUF1493 family protein [Deltaproteobacteria bacterium]|nr:DUF1493 family protein [Deltaproteobacteria bacterium]